MKKIIPYLILNFFVSAAAMAIVLLIWNATHKAPGVAISTDSQPIDLAVVTKPTPTLLPLDTQSIEIQVVVGAGDINLEHIQLVSIADMAIDLQGWKIRDEQHHEYIFPSLIIYPEGGLSLYTRSGANTSIEIFWGMKTAVWSSGETVELRDAEGNLRSSYRIP